MRQKQVTLRSSSAELPCMRHPSSYFVWLPMPDDLRADQVAMALQTAGHFRANGRTAAAGVQSARKHCSWPGFGAARNCAHRLDAGQAGAGWSHAALQRMTLQNSLRIRFRGQ